MDYVWNNFFCINGNSYYFYCIDEQWFYWNNGFEMVIFYLFCLVFGKVFICFCYGYSYIQLFIFVVGYYFVGIVEYVV